MKELIPTDVEIFGYKNVIINNQKITDLYIDRAGLLYCDYRIQLDMTKPLVIDLGHGREIRIKFHANKTDIS